MQNYEYLGKPLQIGRLTIKNRFCMAPIGGGQHHLPGGGLKDETIQYLVERAKGGFGLIFTGAIAADGTVDPYTGVGPTILQNPDAFKMTATELNERAGAYGTKVFAQITMGLGRNYPNLPAPSSVHVFRHPGEVSPELTRDQIKSKIESVVKASKIAKDSGFSGVEVHSIHWGYLLDQFALSMMNHRTDEYGGSLENRLRAAKEILEGIKQECGSDFPVSMRLGLKTFVKGFEQAIQTFITTAWNAIKNTVTTVLNAIKTVITTVWNGIKTAVTTVVNAIKNVISTVWNGIKNTVSTVVNGIKNTVSTVFNNIKSSISGTMGNIVSVIKNGFNNAISFITSLPSKALQWGKDMIMGIVNGIKSCIGAVGDAVSSVANKIKSFLHFSVPDEGPLTDYESWMPDFMKGLAKGIEDSKSMVAKAVNGVAADMVLNPSATVQEISVSGNGGDGVSQGGSINGPLIEVKEMNVRSEEDIRKISQQLYRQLQQGRRANGYS